ncbi:MAG: DsbE family thiol:disulfide interchange protein [Pseudomonadota bacterium]
MSDARRRLIIAVLPLAVFAGLVTLFIAGVENSERRSELPSPLIGKSLPAFELPELRNPTTTINSDQLTGDYLLVNVWASWCFACRQEHDFLLSLAERDEIRIVGLNWRDTRPAALKWLGDLGDPYAEILFDGDGRAGIDFGVYGAPETFLIAPNGDIVAKHIGPLNEALWQDKLAPLIRRDGS